MRTVKTLKAYFKKHKFNYLDDYDYDAFDDEDIRYFKFNVGGKRTRHKYSWSSGYHYTFDGGYDIGGGLANATYCCGVSELGAFVGGDKNEAHWKAIIEYILQVKKLTYLRTETITKSKTTQCIEKALIKLGFRLVTTIKSKHAARESSDPKDQYDINVWEWLKPNE